MGKFVQALVEFFLRAATVRCQNCLAKRNTKMFSWLLAQLFVTTDGLALNTPHTDNDMLVRMTFLDNIAYMISLEPLHAPIETNFDSPPPLDSQSPAGMRLPCCAIIFVFFAGIILGAAGRVCCTQSRAPQLQVLDPPPALATVKR